MAKLEHFCRVRELIEEADKHGALHNMQGLTGFSGEKLVGMLQRLARYQHLTNGGCYLEVGVFQGLTLISVASVLGDSSAYGIDNFAQFDPQKENQKIIQERMELNNVRNAVLINQDYEDALENLGRFIGDQKVGVYFFDGPHDYRSQLMGLQLAKRYLGDRGIIVIDDCNYRHVRLANRDFLVANPEFKLLFDAYTKSHPKNMTSTEQDEVRKGWWNGINVIVKDPDMILDPIYPPTLRDRTLYENEHLLHTNKYGVVAPEAVSFVTSILGGRFIRAGRQLIRIISKVRGAKDGLLGQYSSMNTFSESLTADNWNPTIKNDCQIR